jgi:hypothetical protein
VCGFDRPLVRLLSELNWSWGIGHHPINLVQEMKLGFTNRWTGFYRLRSCAPLYLVKLIPKQKIPTIQWSLLLLLFLYDCDFDNQPSGMTSSGLEQTSNSIINSKSTLTRRITLSVIASRALPSNGASTTSIRS